MRTEAVFRVVGACNGLFFVGELEDGHDRAEDLFLGNGHIVLDVGKDGRLDEIALVAHLARYSNRPTIRMVTGPCWCTLHQTQGQQAKGIHTPKAVTYHAPTVM